MSTLRGPVTDALRFPTRHPARLALAGILALAGLLVGSSQARPSGASGSWPLPNANLQSTRDVSSPINSSTVKTLDEAWSLPIRSIGGFGSYATTPIIDNGVIYTQDMSSNVYAISLATGKLEWFKKVNSLSDGPDGVTESNGVVYGATNNAAFALRASTGVQLWAEKLTRNDHEGIDMAPGLDDGTVYVSTVPVTAAISYAGDGQGVLFAIDAKTGKVKWRWDEVPTDLWSEKNVKLNSGGGLWEPPSFDSHGDVYLGTGNPGPLPGVPKLPNGSSRPGADLYTDSIVKLNHETGKLDWYYQLTPHDIHDWDMQNSPILTTANGKSIVIDGGKAGFVIALDAATGKLLWRQSVGRHNGHDNDGLLTLAQANAKLKFPYTVYPGILGGVETPLASDGTNVYAAVVNLASTYTNNTFVGIQTNIAKATGELVAINQATGKIVWDHKLAQAPYGSATVTNDVLFTTTFDGTLWAFDTKSGTTLWHAKLPAGTNAPVAVAGDSVVTAGSFPLTKNARAEIVAYRLGA